MKPLVVFADPEAAVVTYLAAAYAGRVELYKPTTVTTSYPSTKLTTYHLQVELEVGNADDYPISERAQVRVTCHAPPGKRSNIKDLASLTQGLLYTHPGDSDVAGVFIQGGRSDVSTDPATGNLMVWLLARVVLKATPVAS
jgi:hypothetical protein